jgi:hypothetical protein
MEPTLLGPTEKASIESRKRRVLNKNRMMDNAQNCDSHIIHIMVNLCRARYKFDMNFVRNSQDMTLKLYITLLKKLN